LKGITAAVTALLGLLVLLSALGVVWSKHQSRQLFGELQALEERRDEYNAEWSRLQLEQSTWGTHARIEGIAREQLDMERPPMGRVIIVRD